MKSLKTELEQRILTFMDEGEEALTVWMTDEGHTFQIPTKKFAGDLSAQILNLVSSYIPEYIDPDNSDSDFNRGFRNGFAEATDILRENMGLKDEYVEKD